MPHRKLKRREKFSKFIYNKENKTYCKKKPVDWLRIWLYIIIFNGAIFGMFVAMVYFSREYLKLNCVTGPFFDKNQLSPNPTPALNYFPEIKTIESAIVTYVLPNPSHGDTMLAQIEKEFNKYKAAVNNNAYTDCKKSKKQRNKPCFFNLDLLGPCKTPDYGYDDTQKPCVFFKVNKYAKWMPEAYDTHEDIESSVHDEVVKILTNRDKKDKNNVFFHCAPIHGFSSEHYNISYYPPTGFSFDFFPFENEDNYLSPLVAIKFDRIDKGHAIMLNCAIYAKNILEEHRIKQSLELMIYVA